MDIPAWISAIAALVSLIGAAFSFWWKNLSKEATNEAQVARDRAERQATAAEREAQSARDQAREAYRLRIVAEEQLKEARRQADSAEALVKELRGQREAERNATPWAIRWVRGVVFTLVNNSDEQQRDVNIRLTLDDEFIQDRLIEADDFPCTIDAQTNREFWYLGRPGLHPIVHISWTRPDGQTGHWEIPLPPAR